MVILKAVNHKKKKQSWKEERLLLVSVCYKLNFEVAIRVHYVYQVKWTSELNLRFKCAIDTRDEAMEHDENAIIIYFYGKGREAGFVGHLSKEISKFIKQFLSADKNNLVMATIFGKRKREVDLVIPCQIQSNNGT